MGKFTHSFSDVQEWFDKKLESKKYIEDRKVIDTSPISEEQKSELKFELMRKRLNKMAGDVTIHKLY